MLLFLYRIINPVSSEYELDLIQVRESLERGEIKKYQVQFNDLIFNRLKYIIY